jgi:hypothetical protein
MGSNWDQHSGKSCFITELGTEEPKSAAGGALYLTIQLHMRFEIYAETAT